MWRIRKVFEDELSLDLALIRDVTCNQENAEPKAAVDFQNDRKLPSVVMNDVAAWTGHKALLQESDAVNGG